MKRIPGQVQDDNIPIVSAGVAFYFFLALFPAIAALISVYGLVMDPRQVQEQISQLSSFLPSLTQQFLIQTLQSVANTSGQALSWGVVLSILLSLWSANKGTKALFRGVNIAYDEKKKRNFFKENGLTLLLTFGGIVVGVICLGFIVGFPALTGNVGLPGELKTIISWGRWVILGLIITGTIALIYKYAPIRRNPKFRWVTWGSIVATVLWLVGSWAFSYFVNNFGNFNKTYGSVAAIIILLLWFFLTSFLILIGAEINSEMEHQTRKDTTIGERKPMGKREAYHADHVAEVEER